MRFNRRGFLASLALPFLAPYLPKVAITNPAQLTFKGVPLVFDEYIPTGTMGFVGNWHSYGEVEELDVTRLTHFDTDTYKRIYDECRK